MDDIFSMYMHRRWRYEETLRNFQRQFGSYHRNRESWARTQIAEAELAKADADESLI